MIRQNNALTCTRSIALLLAMLVSLLAFVQARPANAQATFPIIQDFRSPTAPGWLLSGSTALTANTEGAGNGWLRLTSASGNQAGTAIYNTAFPSTDGIVVRFSYATYGGSGADGFSFFLLDGSTVNPQPGPSGGALGYSRSGGSNGLANAYVGIGFDEFGNFSADNLLGTPPGSTPFTPNSIALRGSGNGLTGYRYLTGKVVGQGIATGSRAGARPVEIIILGGKITVKVDYGSGYVTEINEYDLSAATGQVTLPATFKLGFSGSTGGSTNFHEIRDASIRKPGDLSIAMSADKTVAGSGQPVVLTVVVRNDNTNTANGVSVLSTSPGLTYGAWTCTASTGSTCPASGSGNLNASVNLDRNGTATFTINTTFTPSAGAGSVQATAQLNTDPSDISDLNSANNQASVQVNNTFYSVSASVSGGFGGTVNCTPASVAGGGTASCTAVPDAGSRVLTWGGDCAAAGSNVQCSLTNILANKTSTVSFAPIPPATYPVTATVVGGFGSVGCFPSNVKAGDSSTCIAVPKSGFRVLNWGGACASAGSNVQCNLTNIQAKQVSTVSFELTPPATYTVTATVVVGSYGGSVGCFPGNVKAGESSTCIAVAKSGFRVLNWGGACAAAGSNSTCSLTKIKADQVSTVSFELTPPATYNVTATVTGGNGSVGCYPNSVKAGENSTCIAVAYAGFQVESWGGACAAAGNAAQCSLTNIQADQSSTVRFVAQPAPTFTISATVTGGNGAVSCAPSPVPQGDSSGCTAVPDPGYQVAAWTGDCAASGQNVHCALSNIQADQTSTVNFTAIPPNSYTVTASVALGHGSVSCTPNTVTSGGSSACTAVPEAGYQVTAWTGDCAAAGHNAQCYLSKIKADQNSTVRFAPLPPATYTVSATVTGGNGHVSCAPGTVNAGGGSTCIAVPDAGYAVLSWTGDCAASGGNAQCDLTNIQADQSSTVRFAAQSVPTYAISASVDGGNGTVSCAPSPVPQGDSSGCTAVPDPGYQIAAWTGACAATGHIAHCALSNVQSDQTSTVRFELIPPNSYSVTATVDLGHGSVSCTPGTVTAGGGSTCIAVPEAGYQVHDWSGDCAPSGSQAQCHLTHIRANQVSAVSFTPLLPATYTISATVTGGNGAVGCNPSRVNKGGQSTCTAAPATGHQVQDWSGDCAAAGNNVQCYLPKIQKNQTSTVRFSALPPGDVHITARVVGGNGTVSCTPANAPVGGSSTCIATPDAGYQVAHWDGACLLSGQNAQCHLTNLQTDLTSTVTFESTRQDTLTVIKRTVGGDGAFPFVSRSLGDFSLTTVNGEAQRSFGNLAPGLYDLSETVPAGWIQTSATCDNGDAPDNIDLNPGETVVCVFTNVKQDSIVVEKQAQGDDGAFAFASPQLGPFTLTTRNGVANRAFTGLAAGTYNITETTPADWIQISAVCDNGDVPDNINLAPGQTVRCTFVNRYTSTIADIPTLSEWGLLILGVLLLALGAQWYGPMRLAGRR